LFRSADLLAGFAIGLPRAALRRGAGKPEAHGVIHRARHIGFCIHAPKPSAFDHNPGGMLLARLRADDLDGAAGGVAAIERSLRAAQNFDALNVKQNTLGHHRDRIGDIVHIDADGRRVVGGVIAKADTANGKTRLAGTELAFDFKVGRVIFETVHLARSLRKQVGAGKHIERNADILRRLFAPLCGDDDFVLRQRGAKT